MMDNPNTRPLEQEQLHQLIVRVNRGSRFVVDGAHRVRYVLNPETGREHAAIQYVGQSDTVQSISIAGRLLVRRTAAGTYHEIDGNNTRTYGNLATNLTFEFPANGHMAIRFRDRRNAIVHGLEIQLGWHERRERNNSSNP
jgi:hypothetical protein